MRSSDSVLFEKWLSDRDAEAFRELVGRYSGMVYGTCRRILGNPSEAEDVAQECFERVASMRKAPRPYFGAWLHRVATNRSLNYVKLDRRRREREKRFAETRAQRSETTWDDVREHVDEAIAQLPEDLRVPIVAHFLEGQSHEVVSKWLSVSRQTVTYRIGKGIERIRKSLQRRGVIATPAVLAGLLESNLAEAAPSSLAAALGKIAIAGPDTSVAAGVTGTGAKLSALKTGIGALGMKHVAALILVFAVAAGGIWVVSRVNNALEGNQTSVAGGRAQRQQTTAAPGSFGGTVAPEQGDSGGSRLASVAGEETFAATPDDTSRSSFILQEDGDATVFVETKGDLSITGRVTNESGEPIEGARIEDMGPSHRVATSGPDGAYALTELAGGQYSIEATCTGHRPERRNGVPAGSVAVDFALRKASSVEGIVIGEDTGLPVTAFDIGYTPGSEAYIPPDDVHTRLEHVEDPEGRFRIDNVLVGEIILLGRAPGYAATPQAVAGIVPGETVTGVIFTLDRGRVIEGFVLDPEGYLVADARVYIGAFSGPGHGSQDVAHTDANGQFRLETIPRTAARLSAYHPDFAPGSTEIPLDDADIADVEILLGHGGTVEGTVTAGGEPVASRGVSMKQHNFTWVSTQTAQDGTYQFAGVVPGDAEVRASGPGGTKVLNALVEEGMVTVVNFEFPATSGELQGRITLNGAPPPWASVRLRVLTDSGDQRLSTGANVDGTYAFESVPAGIAQLSVRLESSGYSGAYNKFVDLEIRPGASTHQDVNLAGNVCVSGTVTGDRYNVYDRVYILHGEVTVPEPVTLHVFREF